jgi:transcriptional regulator with XRE-family HTH domain
MEIGENIKLYRKKRGLTQTELGNKIGVTGATITRYEKGQLNPSVDKIDKIAIALDIPMAKLMSIEDNESLTTAYEKYGINPAYILGYSAEKELYSKELFKDIISSIDVDKLAKSIELYPAELQSKLYYFWIIKSIEFEQEEYIKDGQIIGEYIDLLYLGVKASTLIKAFYTHLRRIKKGSDDLRNDNINEIRLDDISQILRNKSVYMSELSDLFDDIIRKNIFTDDTNNNKILFEKEILNNEIIDESKYL